MLWLTLLSLMLISAGGTAVAFVGIAALFKQKFNSPHFARGGIASLLIGLAIFAYVLNDIGVF